MAELDPKTRALLELMASLGDPPLAESSPQEVRERRSRGRDLINNPSPDLPVIRDVTVADAEGPLKARIYDTEDGGARPTLVYYHGGGFVLGDIESHDPLCRRLAHHGGFRVISIDYRLALEAPFPAPVEDAIAAAVAITEAAETYGVDPSRLALGGDSAGANLATVAARHFARHGGPELAFQLLFYPVTQSVDTTPSREKYADGYFLTKEGMDWFDSHYLPEGTDRADERVSPLRAAPPEGLAPALVVTAGFDPLVDEGRDYAEQMRASGVDVQYIDYPDQIHGFISFTRFSNVAEDAIVHAARAVRDALL